MRKETVLGLSVGTQLMGLARITNGSLEDWQVKNFVGKWTKIKLKIILLTIERYMKAHNVEAVTLKVPESCRSSPAVKMLINAIVRLCESKSVPVVTYTINDLKSFCNAKNKGELMEAVVACYPELTYALTKANQIQKVYYVKIFEAVLATML